MDRLWQPFVELMDPTLSLVLTVLGVILIIFVALAILITCGVFCQFIVMNVLFVKVSNDMSNMTKDTKVGARPQSFPRFV